MWALIPLVLGDCSAPVACLAGRTALACDDWCWSLRSAGEAACNNAYKVNDASLGATWSATGTQGPRACYWHSATSTCKWSDDALACPHECDDLPAASSCAAENPTWRDASAYSCSFWGDFDCSQATSFGYTQRGSA